jgi:hypothetical protein
MMKTFWTCECVCVCVTCACVWEGGGEVRYISSWCVAEPRCLDSMLLLLMMTTMMMMVIASYQYTRVLRKSCVSARGCDRCVCVCVCQTVRVRALAALSKVLFKLFRSRVERVYERVAIRRTRRDQTIKDIHVWTMSSGHQLMCVTHTCVTSSSDLD